MIHEHKIIRVMSILLYETILFTKRHLFINDAPMSLLISHFIRIRSHVSSPLRKLVKNALHVPIFDTGRIT